MANVTDFEKLGAFYLGRRHDLESGTTTDELVLYDSKDLVTHGLIVGMTGSGKTGLGIALIEEAAIDGVPVIVIDPKGDLSNLLLTFPGLTAAEFEPWVNPADAERDGQSRAEFAGRQAARWKAGLEEWGQDGARIQRLRDAARFTIYTPGSSAGTPVSVLGSFARPDSDDPEIVQERVQTDVSSLLALAGRDAEPLKSREHILLSAILARAWEEGESPDLAQLVHRVQQPPMARVGVIDVDSFFPPKERFEFAMAINALLASPGFSVWTEGPPLGVASFLRAEDGRPQVSIFSLAHLDDSQRMFFVSLLLNAVTAWMRTQSGTTSLRALVYMDEIFGFFPPVANPPSKLPLLTLLKQGRAVGLGVVLATQNPVDLDYKGLSNIGTWWLGRLQTDRDKARVLDGLESASSGARFDRAEVDRFLSGLTSRLFLMRNVHEEPLTLLKSRWALSYLRGPLSRDETRRLAAATRPPEAAVVPQAALPHGAGKPGAPGSGRGVAPAAASTRSAASAESPESSATGASPASAVAGAGAPAAGDRPLLPPDVPQFFAGRVGGAAERDAAEAWRPVLYGAADVRFVDRKLKIDAARQLTFATAIEDGAVPVDWALSSPVALLPDALEREPADGGRFAPLPPAAARGKNYVLWTRQFAAWVVGHQTLELLRSPSSGTISQPGEPEREFRARLHQSAREARDRALDELRRKYAPKQAALAERIRRAEQALERETEQASSQRAQTAISFGATLVGALLGRKAASVATLGRATTAARGVGRSRKEQQDVARARETLDALQADRERLEADLSAETAALESTIDAATERLERVVVPLKKPNVQVKVVALVWTRQLPGRGQL